ncbi:MAG: hypothetical protein Q4D25_01505 [Bacteroidales bacterium]|nr:hypothetical protein [Bacteroidales bacterium]
MKTINTIYSFLGVLFLQTICMGCQNSSNNTELSKDSQRAAIAQENVAPIHVICNQLVNGYRVSMDMLMDGEEENWGSAVFTFQKPQHSFTVNCDLFVMPKEAVQNTIDTIRLDYVPPAPEEYLSDKSLFYFKDMDFDGEDELVIRGAHCSWYGSNQYDVYKVFNRDKPQKMVDEPFEWAGQPMSDRWTEYIPKERKIVCWFSSGTRLIRKAIFQSIINEKGKRELRLVKDDINE